MPLTPTQQAIANEQYISNAETMLDDVYHQADDTETKIQDALADLLHLAAVNDLDIEKLAKMAVIHVKVERGDMSENEV